MRGKRVSWQKEKGTEGKRKVSLSQDICGFSCKHLFLGSKQANVDILFAVDISPL
jgi:hypothetical protein